MPSSMEDEGSEESHQAVAVETEARLQEAAVEEVEEKPVPITNGAVSAVANGQAISDNGNKSGTYIYDSTQKIFTAHQPKTPFIKKKIKIYNSAKVVKSDTPAGAQASEERRAKDETSTSVALVCTESVQFEGNSEEVMEVENTVCSSVVDSDSRNLTEQHQKSEPEEVLLVERPSKDENVSVEVTVPSQKEQLAALVSPAALTSTSHTASGTVGKQAVKHEKEAGCKDTEENVEMQNQSPHITSTQLLSSAAAAPQQPLSTAKKDIYKPEHVTVKDVVEKSRTSTGASLAHRDVESVNAWCESRTASLQSPCEQAGGQLSEKETSPCQKNVSVSRPALLSEVSEPFRMSS